jgi:hypothetical protein
VLRCGAIKQDRTESGTKQGQEKGPRTGTGLGKRVGQGRAGQNGQDETVEAARGQDRKACLKTG